MDSVEVMSALRLVQELDTSPMTPITPSCNNVTAAYTAFVTDIWLSVPPGNESFSISVMYAPGIMFWLLISLTAIRIAEDPLYKAISIYSMVLLLFYPQVTCVVRSSFVCEKGNNKPIFSSCFPVVLYMGRIKTVFLSV